MPQGEVFLLLVFNGFLGQRSTILSHFFPHLILLWLKYVLLLLFLFLLFCVCVVRTPNVIYPLYRFFNAQYSIVSYRRSVVEPVSRTYLAQLKLYTL